jgi:sigma-B regulation protein RsbU (phosphoserine phosphatase)
MAKVQSTLRALLPDAGSLSDLGARVNRILYRDGLPNRFATLVYLEPRLDSGRVRVLNAGHMPAVLVTDRTYEELPRGGFALGMMPEAAFVEQHADLRRGEMLLVHSDGLTEAMNGEGEFFGEERLRALLPGLAARSARDAGTKLLAAVDEFVGDTRPFDDLSLIVLKRRD